MYRNLSLLVFIAVLIGSIQAAAQPFAYVTNLDSFNVTVINTADNTVVDTIPLVLPEFPIAVAITPDGSRAYVTTSGSISGSNTITIDTATNTVVGSPIPVGSSPLGIAITPDGSRVYVALPEGSVAVIDTATNTVVVSISLEFDSQPVGIAITPDGSRVYVAQQASNNVTVIDTATNTVVGLPIPVGTTPFRIAITPESTAVTFLCTGFEPPMDNGPVKVKKNRVLPFKAILQDEVGNPITDTDVISPPAIQVLFASNISESVDVTEDALSAGQGTEGNQFEFSIDKWQFNLKTKNYTAAGTYTVSMVSGDTSEYIIDPACVGIFVIE